MIIMFSSPSWERKAKEVFHMKLNPDCIRDTLMALEGVSTTGGVTYTFASFEDFKGAASLEAYSADEIEYHLRQCDMCGFLVGARFGADGSFSVRDISPSAHEFLANIRSDTVYNAAKGKLAKAGVFSLKALVEVAASVAGEYIAKLL